MIGGEFNAKARSRQDAKRKKGGIMSLPSIHQGGGGDSLSPPKRGEGWGEGH